MTGEDLYQAVAEMGFASSLEENENYFFRAANFALSKLAHSFFLMGETHLSYRATAEYYTDYDLRALATDFRVLPDDALSVEGMSLRFGRDYLFSNGVLRIARRKPCDIRVRYLRAPRPLTPDNMAEPLDVPKVAEHLTPMLVASMLWLEDRPELATHYLALYRTEADELRRTLRHHTADYRVENGWDRP